MEETAYAKINLALHVRRKLADGYHEIETLFAFAEDGDRLEVQASEELTLEVVGPFAGQLTGGNLVMEAAEALRERYGAPQGAALILDKKLPVASGIGGGSADAAAALRLLVRWWGLPFEQEVLLELAAQLGADVPACLASAMARGTGRGDRLAEEEGGELSGMPLLLVNPAVPVSTRAVFEAWGGRDGGALERGPPLEAAIASRNDLEAPARKIAPEIGQVLDVLGSSPGVVLGRMSGSGATCFALFERGEDRDSSAAAIADSHSPWWWLSTRLR